MKQYSHLIGATDQQHHMLYERGTTTDIMNTVAYADKKAVQYCRQLAAALVGNTPAQTCYNIWNFWKQNVRYKEDPDGYQYIKSPPYLYETGEGDCKSYSVAVAACLKHLGIPYVYRFVTQTAGDPYHHVYVVAYPAGSSPLIIDCVLPQFNTENAYARKRDVKGTPVPTATPAPAIGRPAIGRVKVVRIGATAEEVIVAPPNTPGYWTNMIADYKKNYFTYKDKLGDQIIKDLRNEWLPGKPLRFSLFLDKFRKNYDAFFTMGFAMSYYFWTDNDVPLPANLAAKREYGVSLYNDLTKFGLRSGTLRTLCDLSCYKTYGVPFDYLVYRAKCMTKYGTPWEPVPGVPYWNVKTGTLINNGAPTLDMAFQIVSCMPYTPIPPDNTPVNNGKIKISDKPTQQAIALPYGQPYWSVGGFVMRNGATDAQLNAYLKANPNRPPINTGNNPTPQQVQAAVDTYQRWLNGNIPALPDVIIGIKGLADNPSVNDGKIRVGKTAIGEPVTAIVSAVVACVVAVATIASIVAKIVNDIKMRKASTDTIPEFKSDFREVYQTTDGCVMYQSVSTGQLKKCCPDGQCIDNPNPNSPENQAGTPRGGFGQVARNTWLWIAGAALVAAYFLMGSSRSRD